MFKYVVILCLGISFKANSISDARLVDFIVNRSAFAEVLGQFAITPTDSQLVENYISSSFDALDSKRAISNQEFIDLLSKLPIHGADLNIRKELLELLAKNSSALKKEDIVTTVNHIIYLANRYGKSVILNCSECVNESLAKNGFKFTIKNILTASSLKVLNNILPKKPSELTTYIFVQMKKIGMGDYSKNTPQMVSTAEEKSLALFLGLAEHGSADQKALIASIKKIANANGRSNLIDPTNPQKFWKVVASDMTSQDMHEWTKTLTEVAERSAKDNILAEEAFYRTLKDKAQGNEYLLKQYQSLKEKRCFFK